MYDMKRLLALIVLSVLVTIIRRMWERIYTAYKEVMSKDDNFKCSRTCNSCTDECKEYGKCSLCENRDCNSCIHTIK